MDTIPTEILFDFFKYLPLNKLIKLEQLNKYLKILSQLDGTYN